jgi:hypothetical protein
MMILRLLHTGRKYIGIITVTEYETGKANKDERHHEDGEENLR